MSIYLETAKKQIKKGTVGLDAIKSNLTRHIDAENKAKWTSDMQVEYDKLFPSHRRATEDEYWESIAEEYRYTKLVQSYEDAEQMIPIDYSEDESYMLFEEWLNETRVVSEAIEATYDEDDIELTPYVPEVTELVRPYIAPTVADTEVEELLLELGYVSKDKVDAQKYLDDTDWYVVRFAETGVEIPSEVLSKREEARRIL